MLNIFVIAAGLMFLLIAIVQGTHGTFNAIIKIGSAILFTVALYLVITLRMLG